MSFYKKALKSVDKNLILLAFIVALGSTLASMVLSEVVELPPCDLCWWQRVLMFPLPLTLGAAVLTRDKNGFVYSLPLAVAGAALSFYHSLLQWGVISEEVTTCSLNGPSCGEPEILWLGFLTIPFGAFLSFAAISLLLIRSAKQQKYRLKVPKEVQNSFGFSVIGLALLTIIAIVIIRAFDLGSS
ncbi:MAG: disulfide bond formation protein B [Candidatus Saccharimonadales bacterium]|nr:disulfide bond formation protein B [Candidatus Saccharimonadales bacterium]